ncbi:peptidylprolyl isomerase [Altererythrobacter sp. Root672]|uniref:peptidylprolyl isomerase n=1 Tax=Altererythrobacter sp. Root672 TaxID=1736584 RepID=UPI0006F5D826|nr:peptidylprolyl isomerase [Altererythrobacter sp. Root672]KRA83428.1 peptidylprolyl isomerase [Altererythrobacter sp. Root672]
MTNRLLAAALALMAASVPVSVLAQDQAAPAVPAPIQSFPLTVNLDQSVDKENILYLDLSNNQRVAIRLVPEWAPHHVERIKQLTRQGFYDGIIFHRVIDGFMAQTGDPTGTGQGGSDLPNLPAEFNRLPHVRGTVSMARAQDKDSANSQFFIVFYPRFSLDKTYTNFGRVIAGMDAVDAIERGEPPEHPTYIVQASIAADNKPPKFAPASQVEPLAPDLNQLDLRNPVSN